MSILSHVSATGADLKQAGLHLSRRLGFTLARGGNAQSLLAVLEQGHLLLREGSGTWHWEQPHLADPAAYEPPQATMEPERARAVVAHANTAVRLRGAILLVPDADAAANAWGERLGCEPQAPFRYGSLGIRGRSVPVGEGQYLTLAESTSEKGPAGRVLRESAAGQALRMSPAGQTSTNPPTDQTSSNPPATLFGVVLQVRSVATAADCLRQGTIYGFLDDFGRLVTDAALPGYGVMIFEE